MRRTLILATLALTCGLPLVTACTPTNSFQGFQAVEQNPADIKAGADTRSTVLAKLGTPTASGAFDKNTWFYISQVSNHMAFYRPRVTRHSVVAIAFAKGEDKVVAVNTYTLQDGRVIAYNGRETPTRGREMSVIEQLIGTIGAGSALPIDQDQTPGSHGDTRH